jgi:hypothetical protein
MYLTKLKQLSLKWWEYFDHTREIGISVHY